MKHKSTRKNRMKKISCQINFLWLCYNIVSTFSARQEQLFGSLTYVSAIFQTDTIFYDPEKTQCFQNEICSKEIRFGEGKFFEFSLPPKFFSGCKTENITQLPSFTSVSASSQTRSRLSAGLLVQRARVQDPLSAVIL